MTNLVQYDFGEGEEECYKVHVSMDGATIVQMVPKSTADEYEVGMIFFVKPDHIIERFGAKFDLSVTVDELERLITDINEYEDFISITVTLIGDEDED